MKKCNRCFKFLKREEFTYKSSKQSYSKCKKCRNKLANEYRNAEHSKIKLCGKCNKLLPMTLDHFFKKLKGYSNQCKLCTLIINKQKYNSNKEKYLKQKQQYYMDNKDKIREYKQKYKNSDLIKTYYKKLYQRKRADPLEYCKKCVASRIMCYLKSTSQKKNRKTEDILSCSKLELYKHLTLTFEKNYKIKWKKEYLKLVQIDHIIPISKAKTEEEVYTLNHYSNLQFLYKKDNILKSDSVEWILDLNKTNLYKEIEKGI